MKTVTGVLSVVALSVCLPHAASFQQVGSVPNESPGPTSVPTFQPGPCPIDTRSLVEGRDVRCGTVEVPANRARPSHGHIELAVAVLPAETKVAEADPVIFLDGGPGAPTLQNIFASGDASLRHWNDRDLIIFDQRGVGSSGEWCPGVYMNEVQLAEDADSEELYALNRRQARACLEAARKGGHDLADLNTVENAHDVDDIRRALGYDHWNLWGLSYGGRLALEVMRQHPEPVRSVILESAPPPDAPYALVAPNFRRAMGVLQAECDAQPHCTERFGDIGEGFRKATDHLLADPIELVLPSVESLPDGRFVLNAHDFQYFLVHQMLYFRDASRIVPLLIDAVEQRDTPVLTNLLTFLINLTRSGDYETSTATWVGVMCQDQDADFAKALAQSGSSDGYLPEVWTYGCADLGLPGPSAPSLAPVDSDIPTLVLSGSGDPAVPPSYGRKVVETLSRGTQVVVPGAHHHVLFDGSDCIGGIAAAFVDDPTAPLDTSCAHDVKPMPIVVQAARSPGVFRMMSASLAHPAVLLSWLGSIALIFLSVLVGWPLASGIRRLRTGPGPATEARWARWLGGLAALANLLALAGLGLGAYSALKDNLFILILGLPADYRGVFWLIPMAATLSLVVILTTFVVWRRRLFHRWSRVHYTLLGLASAGFVAFTIEFGLL